MRPVLVPLACLVLAFTGCDVVVRDATPPPPPPPAYTWTYYADGSVYHCREQGMWYWRDAQGWWTSEHPPGHRVIGQPVEFANHDQHPEVFAADCELRHRVHRYRYYPSAEVYYAYETRVWFWNNQGAWCRGHEPPIGLVMRDPIDCDLSGEEPFHHHASVRGRFPPPRAGGPPPAGAGHPAPPPASATNPSPPPVVHPAPPPPVVRPGSGEPGGGPAGGPGSRPAPPPHAGPVHPPTPAGDGPGQRPEVPPGWTKQDEDQAGNRPAIPPGQAKPDQGRPGLRPIVPPPPPPDPRQDHSPTQPWANPPGNRSARGAGPGQGQKPVDPQPKAEQNRRADAAPPVEVVPEGEVLMPAIPEAMEPDPVEVLPPAVEPAVPEAVEEGKPGKGRSDEAPGKAKKP